MKYSAVFLIVFTVLFSSEARAGEFEDQIRKLYADQAEIMSQREIDIPAILNFTGKYYADDIVMKTNLLNTNTGKTDISTTTKKQMLAMIPEEYKRTFNNRMEISIGELSLEGGPWHAVVKYDSKYEARLRMVDTIGRHFERPLYVYFKCEEALDRSARGWPQITASDCKGAMKYGDVEYKSWHD